MPLIERRCAQPIPIELPGLAARGLVQRDERGPVRAGAAVALGRPFRGGHATRRAAARIGPGARVRGGYARRGAAARIGLDARVRGGHAGRRAAARIGLDARRPGAMNVAAPSTASTAITAITITAVRGARISTPASCNYPGLRPVGATDTTVDLVARIGAAAAELAARRAARARGGGLSPANPQARPISASNSSLCSPTSGGRRLIAHGDPRKRHGAPG